MSEKIKQFFVSNWGIFLLFCLATGFVLSQVLIFKHTTIFTNLDNVDQFYSWYQKLSHSLHSGELPIWNANTFGGQNFSGEIQQGIFYPINLIFVWLFGSAAGISQGALEYIVALHFAGGAFGVYLVLRKLGLKMLSSFCAGLIYAFSGVVATRANSQTAIFFGLCLLPYPLFFLLKYYEAKQKLKWLIACGGALGLIILSGHIQPFFHSLLILGIFELSRFKLQKDGFLFGTATPLIKIAGRFLVILLAALIIALPQVWQSYKYLPNTYRVQADGYLGANEELDYGHFAKSFSVEPHEIANMIDPDRYPIRDGNNLFMGLLPLALIILSLVIARNHIKQSYTWQKYSLFIKGLLLTSVLAMLGYWTWFAVFLYELPFVRQVRQLGRYSIIFQLALSVILALAIEAAVKIKLTKKQKQILFAAALFLAINFVYLFSLRKFIFNGHFAMQMLITSVGLGLFAFVLRERIRATVLVALIVSTAFINSYWFLPVINAETKLPSSYYLEPDLTQLLEQTNGKYRIEQEDNAIPINIGNAYNFQTTGGYGATVYAPYFEFTQRSGLDREFIKDLLGVIYMVKKQNPTGKEVVYASKKLFVEKRPTALSKIFTTGKYGSTDRADYHSLLVKTEVYKDHYQKYRLELDADTLAIISESIYPGWQLKVDGTPTEWQVYNVGEYPVFKSVNLTKGSHTLEFEYKPFGR